MSDTKVLVKDSDMISVKSLLALLKNSIETLKTQQESVEDEKVRIAISGAASAIIDLHNLVLSQIQDVRAEEVFEGDDDHGGRFDA